MSHQLLDVITGLDLPILQHDYLVDLSILLSIHSVAINRITYDLVEVTSTQRAANPWWSRGLPLPNV